MPVDIEAMLARELREVADTVEVPAMPRVGDEPARPARRRQPFLAAAAVIAVVAGVAGVATALDNDDDGGPAEPTPSQSVSPSPSPSASATRSSATIPRGAPQLAHVVDGRLHVDGEQVPGDWWPARPAGDAWLGIQPDLSWWWGRGTEPHELVRGGDASAGISPAGRYVAAVAMENGDAVLTLVDTRTGERVGETPVSIGAPRPGSTAHVVAVMDDGRVVVRTDDVFLLWKPGWGDVTRDLSTTAPDQVVRGATPGGLVVSTGEEGQPYLAELSDEGELTREEALPPYDDLAVSPGAEWLAWTPRGTLGGEVTVLDSLEVSTVAGAERSTVSPPDGWQFVVGSFAWEDDGSLVSTVQSTDGDRQRMVRCSAPLARCILLDEE